MNILIQKNKITTKLLNALMIKAQQQDISGFYNVFVRLEKEPSDEQRSILKKHGVRCTDQQTSVFNATVSISTISKLSGLDFVEGIGMIGYPEQINQQEEIKQLN